MKKFKFFSAFIFLISLSNLSATTITLRSDIWCPYACDPKSDHPGFMIELAKEIFKKNGYTIQYDVMNWPRAVSDVRNGKYDGLVGSSRSDAEGFEIPQIPTGVLVNYYWTRADNPWIYKNIESLEGKTIGVINDYTYGNEIDKLVRAGNPAFKEVAGEYPLYRLIQMTETKRIDGFVENPVVLEYTLKKLKKNRKVFKIASFDLASDPDLFIAFAPNKPKSKEYAKMLDDGMNEMRKNGSLKKILARYGLTDWK